MKNKFLAPLEIFRRRFFAFPTRNLPICYTTSMPASKSNTDNAKQPLWTTVTVALIVLGMLCSGYLLAKQLALIEGGSGLIEICSSFFGTDCDSAMQSDLATQLGIPLSGWGVIYFALVAVSLLLAALLGEAFHMAGTLTALLLCGVAVVLGIVLSIIMLSGAEALCPLCLIFHATNLGLLLVVKKASGYSVADLIGALQAALKYLLGADVANPEMVRFRIMGLVTVLLVGTVAYQWVLIQADRQAAFGNAPVNEEELLAEFKASQEVDIPVSDDDPRLGDKDAPLEMVIFSDFECPACQIYALLVTEMKEKYPQLSVVFKHYPLSRQCNSGVQSDMHPLSCDAAYAAEAARRQGKFWEYHDALFASREPLQGELLNKVAQHLGLDMNQFTADRTDTAIKAKVDADIALGIQLNIKGTPTPFINNKPVPGKGLGYIDLLINSIINKQ